MKGLFVQHWMGVAAGATALVLLFLVVRAVWHWRAAQKMLDLCAREVVAVMADLQGNDSDKDRIDHLLHYLAEALDLRPGFVRARRSGQLVEVVIRGPVGLRATEAFERRVINHPQRPPWVRFEIRLHTSASPPWARPGS